MSNFAIVLRIPFFIAALAIAASANAQDRGVNIMAGPALSTSLKISEDIGALTQACGLPAIAHQTTGALENLLELKERRYTQFAIMQSDVLEYLKTFETDDPQIGTAIDGIRVAMPLFAEEVHVLARKDIPDMASLDGRRVSIGGAESGTFLTATLMLRLLGIEPSETFEFDPIDAFAAMAADEIDAFFFVDGAPTPLFKTAEFDPEAVHLLPIDDPLMQAAYKPALIRAGTYPFLDKDLDVVSVESVLLTFNYVRTGRNRYSADNCQMVADVTSLIKQNINSLAATGHPKWAEVDLDFEVPDWLFAGCAVRGLNPDYRPICQ